MSSLESVQKWLENPLDYFSGVLLFSKYCKNKNLLANLQRSETDYNSEKLKYELDKILEHDKEENPSFWKRKSKSNASDESCSEHQQENDAKECLPNNRDVNISSLHNNNNLLLLKSEVTKNRNDLYAKRNFMHAQLHGVLSESELFNLAENIVNIQPKIDKYNSQLKYIEEHNAIPSELQKSTMTAEEMRKQLNVKTYISRYKSKIKTAKTLEEKKKYEKLLDKYENLI